MHEPLTPEELAEFRSYLPLLRALKALIERSPEVSAGPHPSSKRIRPDVQPRPEDFEYVDALRLVRSRGLRATKDRIEAARHEVRQGRRAPSSCGKR